VKSDSGTLRFDFIVWSLKKVMPIEKPWIW